MRQRCLLLHYGTCTKSYSSLLTRQSRRLSLPALFPLSPARCLMALTLKHLIVNNLDNSNLPLARSQDDQAILGKALNVFRFLILDLSKLELRLLPRSTTRGRSRSDIDAPTLHQPRSLGFRRSHPSMPHDPRKRRSRDQRPGKNGPFARRLALAREAGVAHCLVLRARDFGRLSPVDEFEHFACQEVLGEAFSWVCSVGDHRALDGGQWHECEEGKVAGYICVGGAEEEL